MSKSVAAGGSTIHLSRKICEDNEAAAIQLVQQFARRATTYPASRRPAPSTSFAGVRLGPSGLPLPIRDRDPRRVSRERTREREVQLPPDDKRDSTISKGIDTARRAVSTRMASQCQTTLQACFS